MAPGLKVQFIMAGCHGGRVAEKGGPWDCSLTSLRKQETERGKETGQDYKPPGPTSESPTSESPTSSKWTPPPKGITSFQRDQLSPHGRHLGESAKASVPCMGVATPTNLRLQEGKDSGTLDRAVRLCPQGG